eukprot:16387-Heterococcus_DN1.PRE.4
MPTERLSKPHQAAPASIPVSQCTAHGHQPVQPVVAVVTNSSIQTAHHQLIQYEWLAVSQTDAGTASTESNSVKTANEVHNMLLPVAARSSEQ